MCTKGAGREVWGYWCSGVSGTETGFTVTPLLRDSDTVLIPLSLPMLYFNFGVK
jgi:hypothetical protein